MIRRGLALFVTLLVVLGACDSSADTTTTRGAAPSTTTTITIAGPTTTSTLATTTTTEIDLSDLSVPEAVQGQLEELVSGVQDVRGLRFLTAPNITVVDDVELEARVRQSILEEAGDLPADGALYKLLGLLDEGADFQSLLEDLYGEQVAGFYDGETAEIVVPAREEGLSVLQRGTLLHELVHALTDQHFRFHDAFEAMLDDERLDQAAAYQALIEGDATLAELTWVRGLSQAELGEFVAESLGVDSAQLEGVPQFLQDSLVFPYDSGLAFTQAIHQSGDWVAVNEAYTALIDLPGSSEQVITPGDYRRDLPVPVDIPDVTVPGYQLERTSVWGESGFRIMLNQVLGAEVSRVASDGWGGDSYHQWFDGANAAFLLVFEGDTPGDTEELRQALLDFALASVAEEDFVWVDESEGHLYFIAADETAVGELIRSAVGLG